MTYKIYKGNTEIKKLYIGNKQVRHVYKGSQLVYSSFEAPQINQPKFTSNTTNGVTVDDHLHRSNLYELFNGVSSKYNTGNWADCWFSIAYPQQVVVTSYMITFGPAAQTPYEWYLQGSNDNSSWTNISHITGQNHADYTSQTYNSGIQYGIKYKYYRLKFVSGALYSGTGALRRLLFYTTAF